MTGTLAAAQVGRPDPGRWSREAFRQLVELLPDAVLITGEGGTIRTANRVAGKMFGYTRRELLALTIEDLIPGRFRRPHRDRGKKFLSRPRRRSIDKMRGLVAMRKDGSEFPVEIGLSPIGKGPALEMMSVVRDISERRRGEDEIRESELRYRSLVELSPEAIIVHVGGKILYANQAAADLLMQKSPAGLTGKSMMTFVPAEYRDEVRKRIHRPSPVGTLLPPMTLRARRADGSDVILESMAVRTPYRGHVATQVLLRDMTEREHARSELIASREQLRNLSAYLQAAREEERSAVAREIHDELGQALTALKMDLSNIADAIRNGDESSRRTAVGTTIASMSSIIDTTIQSVRRISTGLRPVLLDSLGLGAAVEWQADEFSSRTGIPCQLRISPRDLTADMERSTAVFRIFQEALTNIARHAGATKVSVRLGKTKGALILEVRDDGKGITESDMRKPKSFGLVGMRERALLLQGTVSVAGRRGAGSTVSVRIPLGSMDEAVP